MLRTRIIIVLVVATATVTAVVGVLFPPIDLPPPSAIETPEAATPEAVVADAEVGEGGLEPFIQFCSECHGELAVGTDQGPPLVHDLYEPNHHADAAFVRAARRGRAQHHWNFGNMPPVRTSSSIKD